IGDYAFNDCSSLTTVLIPNSVISIRIDSFWGCTNLTAINVGTNNPVYSSVNGVLFDKGQTRLIEYPEGKVGSYSIPNSVTSIGDYAFWGCTGLTGVTIGHGVTTIGDHAFWGCTGLISVLIPNSVTWMYGDVFGDCSRLVAISVETKNPGYS